MKKILICEDDIYLQRDLKVLLSKHDYEVITASTSQEGIYHVLNDKDIDLYLLDVWLPDGDGFMVCEQIRKQNLKPVIFLTACNDEESVVKGLDMGADDYIYKPFRTAELLSRIKANLRHQKKDDNARLLCCDNIRLDITQGSVTLKGEVLGITPIESRLLQILMSNSERIVKREQLSELRRTRIGFVYQDYSLFSEFTAYENIVIPIRLNGGEEKKDEIEALMNNLGIGYCRDKFPGEMSGGEQQRVAIARALAVHPAVVFADEPTGNLDVENSNEVVMLLSKAARMYNQTIVMVTHDMQTADYADRIIKIRDGVIE